MATCAVLDKNNVVVNIIVAEPTDLPPEEHILVLVNEGEFVDIGCIYDGVTFNPQ
jgi:hypothetical protein